VAVGRFTDKRQRPTEKEIRAAIGPGLCNWDALLAHIRQTYVCAEELKYLYGRSYGWALRFRSGRRLLANLYPCDGSFTVQINLSPASVDQASAIAPGRNVQAAIERARPYPEGRWLFISVDTEDDLADVRALLALRAAEQRIPQKA